MKLIKTVFSPYTFALVAFIVCFTSCEETVNEVIEPPTVSYPNNELDATFFEAGSSPAPTIDWKGNVGTINLISDIEGISVDGTTGAVSWDKDLATGVYPLRIAFTNEGGSTEQSVTLENAPVGIFTGSFIKVQEAATGRQSFLQVELLQDNTLNVEFKEGSTTYTSSGSWEYVSGPLGTADNEIEMRYTVNIGSFVFDYFYESNIIFDASSVKISGDYFLGDGGFSDVYAGTYEVVLQ